METYMTKSIQKMALANFLVWITILLTGAFSIWFFRSFDPGEDLMEQGAKLLILKSVSFFLSLGVSIFGLIGAIQFRKILNRNNISGGGLLLSSMILMLVATLASQQSVTGINIYFGALAVTPVREIFSELSIAGIISLIAMILFMAAVILNYIGNYRIVKGQRNKAAALKGFNKVKNSSLILMITVILFSPVIVSYIAANTLEYENTTLFNSITVAIYLVTVAYYLLTWFMAKNISVIPSNEIVEPEYVTLDTTSRIILSRIGKWYLYTWIVIIASFISLSLYYLSGSRIMAVITLIPYIVGWVMIIQGIRISSNLKDRLKALKLNSGIYYQLSFIVLGIISFLSFNTLVGGNVVSYGLFNWNDISETLSECPDMDSLTSIIEFTNIISSFLFILFPIFILIGTIQLSLVIPYLKKSAIGAALLTLASIIFAPLLIFIAIDEYDDMSLTYFMLSIVCYAVGIFFYSRPWGKCDKILAEYAPVPSSVNQEISKSITDSKKTTMEMIKDPKTLITTIIALFAIIISFITVISDITPNSTKVPLSSPYDVSVDDAIEMIERGKDNPEIYVIDDGNANSDGYADAENEVKNFVNKFYSAVIPKINNLQNYDNLLKEYFTQEFFNLYSTVDEEVPDGDIGFFDYDFISISQDPDLSNAVVESVEVTEHGKAQFEAKVEISLKDRGGYTTPVDMTLIKTPQGWKIKDYNGLFDEMKRFKRELKSQR